MALELVIMSAYDSDLYYDNNKHDVNQNLWCKNDTNYNKKIFPFLLTFDQNKYYYS